MAFLIAEKLVKEYERRGAAFRAVDDIDFAIAPGEFVMIEGESGSGKTTLLNLFTGLTAPTSGSVYIEGKDLKDFDDKGISAIRNKKIKYIPQGESLLSSLTIRENILFPFAIGGEDGPGDARVSEVSLELGISELLDEYPRELSGGEMRRATIARAVINRPSLIIADEPTGSLDSANTKKVMDTFKKIAEDGTAVIVVTHQKETLSYASRVYKMEKGKLCQNP